MAGRGGLDQKVHAGMLLAFYGPMLTHKQREALRMWVEEDYSLSEIALQTGISRQGAHDALQRGQEQLQELESKLHVLERYERTQAGLEAVQALIGQIPGDRARQAERLIEALMTADEEEENGL